MTQISYARISLGAALCLIGCGGGGGSGSGASGATQAPADNASNPSQPVAAAPAAASGSHSGHTRCGWLGADTAAAGTASFVAHPDYFDAVHPKWFTLQPDGTPRGMAFTDDPTVTATARAHHTQLIPLIDYDDVSYLRGPVLSSPAGIKAHVALLVDLAVKHGYDGLELDYEHLWTAADRAGYVALVQQAAAALHAQNKVLTLAVPAMDHDDGNNAYNYAALAAAADVLHLMGYDYHYLGGDHLGPIAPLGWLDAVAARAASIGPAKKFVLGVANYGLGMGWYTSANDAIGRCGGNYTSVDTHMAHCPYGVRTPGRAPHCTTASQGDVYFEDADSVREKAAMAKSHGLGGISYWTVGDEPAGFFAAVQASYP
jgi:spore germination protein YaaH